MSNDPLLTLLRRYQAELEAFEPPIDCLRVAQNTWAGHVAARKKPRQQAVPFESITKGTGFQTGMLPYSIP
jgi:hypothetical protein